MINWIERGLKGMNESFVYLETTEGDIILRAYLWLDSRIEMQHTIGSGVGFCPLPFNWIVA